MKVTQAVAAALSESGVDHVFGLLGSGNFLVANEMVARGAKFIASRHETGAVTMADAYARVSGRLGVCTVHQGPGLTNAITGLTEATKSRTPLLLLAGETSATAIRSNFRIDQAALVASVGALPERLNSPATAVDDALRAARRARAERRPVVLMMPLDVQSGESSTTDLRVSPQLRPSRPDEQAVAEVVRRIESASRPLIIGGRGAVLAGAGPHLEELADAIGGLLATSAVANGLFAENPWSLGISGGFASPVAAELIAQADLVLAFGASLNMWTTLHGRLFGSDPVIIQVDDQPEAFGAHRRVDLAILGDAAETAQAVRTALKRTQNRWRQSEVADRIRKGRWRFQPYADGGTEKTIDPRTLSISLNEMLPSNRAVAVDSGHFMCYPAMYLEVESPDAFIFTQGFQSIGLGLATAIGAAVARPDRITVAALGDGGALMAAPEFETAGRLGVPILIVVYNDAAYSAEVHHFGPMGEPVDLVRFPDTDFVALGRAFGIDGVTVRGPNDLDAVREWAARAGSPFMVDAKVEPTVVAPWLEEAMRGH
ncbi:MAG TPA: thiamine pyrophosphate-binding protein [Candidatus Dormibacteraeota bacterium]